MTEGEPKHGISRKTFLELLVLATGTSAVALTGLGSSVLTEALIRYFKHRGGSPYAPDSLSSADIPRNPEKTTPILLPDEYIELAQNSLKHRNILTYGSGRRTFLDQMNINGFDVSDLMPSLREGSVGKDGLAIRFDPTSNSNWTVNSYLTWGEKVKWLAEIEVKNRKTGSWELFGLTYPKSIVLFSKTKFTEGGRKLDEYSPKIIIMPYGVIGVSTRYIRLAQNDEWFVDQLQNIPPEPILLPTWADSNTEFIQIIDPVPYPIGSEDYRIFQERARVYKDGFFYWPTMGNIFQHYSAEHPAIDIECAFGTAILAAGNGEVVEVKRQDFGLGWHLGIKHPGGFETVYGHNSDIFVDERQAVKRGDLIAAVGQTGIADGPHLHFEIEYNGIPVDPLKYMPR